MANNWHKNRILPVSVEIVNKPLIFYLFIFTCVSCRHFFLCDLPWIRLRNCTQKLKSNYFSGYYTYLYLHHQTSLFFNFKKVDVETRNFAPKIFNNKRSNFTDFKTHTERRTMAKPKKSWNLERRSVGIYSNLLYTVSNRKFNRRLDAVCAYIYSVPLLLLSSIIMYSTQRLFCSMEQHKIIK